MSEEKTREEDENDVPLRYTGPPYPFCAWHEEKLTVERESVRVSS